MGNLKTYVIFYFVTFSPSMYNISLAFSVDFLFRSCLESHGDDNLVRENFDNTSAMPPAERFDHIIRCGREILFVLKEKRDFYGKGSSFCPDFEV